MTGLQRLYGSTPRVRALEAVIELMPREFTASYAASITGEAGRTSFSEVFRELAEEGLLECREEGGRRYYRAVPHHPMIEVASLSDAVLEILSEDLEDREFLLAFEERTRELIERAEGARTTTATNMKSVQGGGQTQLLAVAFP